MKYFRLMFSRTAKGKGKDKVASTKWFTPTTTKDKSTTPVASDFRTILLGTEIVDLYVGLGAEKVAYHVHKDLLCHRVEYFKNMFRSESKEGVEGKAVLVEDSEAVDLLLGWVYTNTLAPLQNPTASSPKSTYNPFPLYILAEKYCIFPLMNLTMDTYRAFQAETSTFLPESYYLVAYEECPPNSPMRKYVSYTLAYELSGKGEVVTLSDSRISELLGQNGDLCEDVVGFLRATGEWGVTRSGQACFFTGMRRGEGFRWAGDTF